MPLLLPILLPMLKVLVRQAFINSINLRFQIHVNPGDRTSRFMEVMESVGRPDLPPTNNLWSRIVRRRPRPLIPSGIIAPRGPHRPLS